jgi:glycosyltransferase involved in cell wall biosynthesis
MTETRSERSRTLPLASAARGERVPQASPGGQQGRLRVGTEPQPLVSVILPVYNGERFVERAIKSVLGQTYRPLELVAIDDGSTDGSREILRRFEPSIRVISQANAGVAAARNRGIAASRGAFVGFLDQDDWWEATKVGEQVAAWAADPRLGLVHTAVSHRDAVSEQEVPPLNPLAQPAAMVGDCYAKLLLSNPLYNSSVMARRDVLEQLGGCSLALQGNTVADYELWLRIAARFRFAYVDRPLTCYGMHAQQGMWDRREMLTAELGVLLQQREWAAWRAAADGRRRLSGLYDELAVAWYDHGDRRRARHYFREAWRAARSPRAFARWAASHLPRFVVERARGSQNVLAPVRNATWVFCRPLKGGL